MLSKLSIHSHCLFQTEFLSASSRSWSSSTWQTGWSTGCGAEAWTPTTSPSPTWPPWETCWVPASSPSASTCAGSSATETVTWATKRTRRHTHKIKNLPHTVRSHAVVYGDERSPVCRDTIWMWAPRIKGLISCRVLIGGLEYVAFRLQDIRTPLCRWHSSRPEIQTVSLFHVWNNGNPRIFTSATQQTSNCHGYSPTESTTIFCFITESCYFITLWLLENNAFHMNLYLFYVHGQSSLFSMGTIALLFFKRSTLTLETTLTKESKESLQTSVECLITKCFVKYTE